ncbi:MAG: 30S ribosomal protein S3 [Candidatus Micrarchaeota archaeon]
MINADKFIEEDLNKYILMKYLEKKLEEVGLASVEIQRTPLVTRISLEVLNPARIIGKRGRLINDLTDAIKNDFKIDNPQISVIEVKNPFLEPAIVARKAAKYIEMGKKVRSVLHYFLTEIMRSGAMGAEIVASGKIGAKGARAKSLRVSKGHVPKAGEPTRLVKESHINANTRSGVIGVLVRILPPGTKLPVPKVKVKHKQRVDIGNDEVIGVEGPGVEAVAEKKVAPVEAKEQKEAKPAETEEKKANKPKAETSEVKSESPKESSKETKESPKAEGGEKPKKEKKAKKPKE